MLIVVISISLGEYLILTKSLPILQGSSEEKIWYIQTKGKQSNPYLLKVIGMSIYIDDDDDDQIVTTNTHLPIFFYLFPQLPNSDLSNSFNTYVGTAVRMSGNLLIYQSSLLVISPYRSNPSSFLSSFLFSSSLLLHSLLISLDNNQYRLF